MSATAWASRTTATTYASWKRRVWTGWTSWATTALKLVINYVMTCGGRTVCTGTSTHCFMENGRPVSLEQRFPELYAKMMECMNDK